MHRAFPIILFVVAALIVLAGVGLRLWNIQIQHEIEKDVAKLELSKKDYQEQLAVLQGSLERPIIVMEEITTRVPEVKCTTKGLIPKCTTTFKEVKTKVPVTKGKETDPVIEKEIEGINSELSKLSYEINSLAERRAKIDNFIDVDKESFRGLLSLLILLSALYVVLARSYGPESQKWAFGAVGTIMGYWFGQ